MTNEIGKLADIYIEFKDGTDINYEDTIGYQVGGGVVAIMAMQGRTLIYPLEIIKFIDHTVKENE